MVDDSARGDAVTDAAYVQCTLYSKYLEEVLGKIGEIVHSCNVLIVSTTEEFFVEIYQNIFRYCRISYKQLINCRTSPVFLLQSRIILIIQF